MLTLKIAFEACQQQPLANLLLVLSIWFSIYLLICIRKNLSSVLRLISETVVWRANSLEKKTACHSEKIIQELQFSLVFLRLSLLALLPLDFLSICRKFSV